MITSVRLMLNKSRRLNNGSYPLVFQVIHGRHKKLMYTGYHVKEGTFDEFEERIIYNEDSVSAATDVTKINRELKKIRRTIHARIHQLERTTDFFYGRRCFGGAYL